MPELHFSAAMPTAQYRLEAGTCAGPKGPRRTGTKVCLVNWARLRGYSLSHGLSLDALAGCLAGRGLRPETIT